MEGKGQPRSVRLIPVNTLGSSMHRAMWGVRVVYRQRGRWCLRVRDGWYHVEGPMLWTYARDPYQLAQVERMVEQQYKDYLVKECKSQQRYKMKMQNDLDRRVLSEVDRLRSLKRLTELELTRCVEHKDLFGLDVR